MSRLYLLLIAWGLSGPVAAQVFKCADSSGRTTYSQSPCAGTTGGGRVKIHDSSIDAFPRVEQDDRMSASPQRGRGADALRREAGHGRVAEDRKDLEEACRKASGEYEEAKARRAPPDTMNKLLSARRLTCGMGEGSVPARGANPGATSPYAPPPSIITSCDPGGCWDNQGNRYNKGAGQTYFPSSGGACQMINGAMHCP